MLWIRKDDLVFVTLQCKTARLFEKFDIDIVDLKVGSLGKDFLFDLIHALLYTKPFIYFLFKSRVSAVTGP